jgi:hypothetical protein
MTTPAGPLALLHLMKAREEARQTRVAKEDRRRDACIKEAEVFNRLHRARLRRSAHSIDVENNNLQNVLNQSMPGLRSAPHRKEGDPMLPVLNVNLEDRVINKRLELLAKYVLPENQPNLRLHLHCQETRRLHAEYPLTQLGITCNNASSAAYPEMTFEEMRASLAINGFPMMDDTAQSTLASISPTVSPAEHLSFLRRSQPNPSAIPHQDFGANSRPDNGKSARTDTLLLGKWYSSQLSHPSLSFTEANTLWSFVSRELIRLTTRECEERGELLLLLYLHTLVLFSSQAVFYDQYIQAMHNQILTLRQYVNHLEAAARLHIPPDVLITPIGETASPKRKKLAKFGRGVSFTLDRTSNQNNLIGGNIGTPLTPSKPFFTKINKKKGLITGNKGDEPKTNTDGSGPAAKIGKNSPTGSFNREQPSINNLKQNTKDASPGTAPAPPSPSFSLLSRSRLAEPARLSPNSLLRRLANPQNFTYPKEPTRPSLPDISESVQDI